MNNSVQTDIQIDVVLPCVKAISQRQVFQTLSGSLAGEDHVAPLVLFAGLLEEEQRQPSGAGNGVAIPHLRLKGLSQPLCLFARLDHPVDWNAADGHPVDLVCLLLSPEGDGAFSLQRLAAFSRLLRNPTLCRQLRGTDDADIIRALLTEPDARAMAA